MSTNPSAFGNSPTGVAGGSLVGTYPNPVIGNSGMPWQLSDNGLLAATSIIDGAGGSTTALVAGSVYIQKVPVRAGFAITNIVYITQTAGSGASTGSFVGVYNPSGTLLSGSADIGANLVAAAGAFTTPLTTPQSAGTVGALAFVWLAMVCNLATTQPVMRGEVTQAFATANLGLTAATARCAVAATVQTTLPAFTPSASTLSGVAIWMGIS